MEEVITFPPQRQIIPTTKDIVKANLVLNNGLIVNVDYHKIGQETSSTVGKISRFFVLMFTLTLVDLYDTRGRTAYKDYLENLEITELKPTEEGVSAVNKFNEQTEKVKRLNEKLKQPVLEIHEKEEKIGEVVQVEPKEEVKFSKIKDLLKKDLVSNVKTHIQKEKFFQKGKTFDEAAYIFIAHYLDGKEPTNLKLAQQAFSYFLDFARPDNKSTKTLLNIDLKTLAIALKEYPKTKDLNNYVREIFGPTDGDKAFIEYYAEKFETSLKGELQELTKDEDIVVEPKGNSVEESLKRMFDTKTPKELKEFKEKNEQKYNQALAIFTQVYLDNKIPQNWEPASESFRTFINFIRPDNKDTKDLDINLEVLAQALKNHKNASSKDSLINFYSKARTTMIENILDDVLQKTHLSAKKDDLVMAGILNEIQLSEIPSGNEIASHIEKQVLSNLDAKLNNIEELLKLIDTNPFTVIRMFFGKAVVRLPEAKEGLTEILYLLEKHQHTLNKNLFGKIAKHLVKISQHSIKMGKDIEEDLGLNLRTKSTTPINLGQHLDEVVNILENVKVDNKSTAEIKNYKKESTTLRKSSLFCNVFDVIVNQLKREAVGTAFKVLNSNFLLNFVGSENSFLMGIKKAGMNIGLKFAPVEFSKESKELLDMGLPIVAKFMTKVLPAMKNDERLKPIVEAFNKNIFNPIIEGKIDDTQMVEDLVDLVIITLKQIKG